MSTVLLKNTFMLQCVYCMVTKASAIHTVIHQSLFFMIIGAVTNQWTDKSGSLDSVRDTLSI